MRYLNKKYINLAVTLIVGLILLAYPIIVYIGLQKYSLRLIGGLLLIPVILRWLLNPKIRQLKRSYPLGIMLILLAGIIFNQERFLFFTPVLINFVLFLTFFITLGGTPIIENFARMQTDDLSVEEIKYCRKLTWGWIAFFLINGVISFLTTFGSHEIWTFYNGFLIYIILGALFSLEFMYRHWRFRHYTGLWSDPLMKRIFPPEENNYEQ